MSSELKTCPYCSEEVRASAVRCRWCRSWLDRRVAVRDWHRSQDDRMIAGVCGGIAQQFDIPTALVRLGFLLTALFMGGMGLVLYVALWVVMPVDRDAIPARTGGEEDPYRLDR